MDRRAHGRQEGIFEGASDAETSLDEERRKPRDKSIDECVCHDQSGGADDQPGEKLRSEESREGTAGVGRKRHGGPGWRVTLQSNLALVLLQHGLSFFVAADQLQPTRRFRDGFTHVPDDECTYATNRQHDAPASPRDEQCADKRAERQAGYHGPFRMPPQRPRAWGAKNSVIAA
jgi:hypothetical protein